jgi:NADH-ubiquinone oxidoreductase chain 3
MLNPVLITLFLFLPVLILVLLALNLIFAPSNPDPEKLSSFECGFTPIFGQTRNPFHIQFYLVAILFLIFDLEIFYLVPLTVSLSRISLYGFSIFSIFFIVLTIGFIYELGAKIFKFSH